MSWKYAQVKVGQSIFSDGTTEEEYDIFELYDLDGEGDFMSFSSAGFTCLRDLKMAITDIERDGTNTWFYENGTFQYSLGEWEWEKNEKKSKK